jgi:glycerophosphoryl diester phosphodiesterase
LDEILALVIAWDKKLYVELKKVDPAKVLAAIEAKNCLDRCFFWGFDWDRVEAVKKLCPEATIMARSLDFVRIPEVVSEVGVAIIEINMLENNIEAKVQAARQAGARVMLCYSGADRDVMRKMFAMTPDLVNIDNTAIWKDVWNEQSGGTLRGDAGS